VVSSSTKTYPLPAISLTYDANGNTLTDETGNNYHWDAGFELARQLSQANSVIITGRDQNRLDVAQSKLGNIHTVVSDVSQAGSIVALRDIVAREFPDLNVLINNAGLMRKISLHDASTDLADLTLEVDTNLSGVIRMTQQFIPLLRKQPFSAIVNVSSGLAFVPFPISPVYSATKAAIHAFTQALRVQMKKTNIKVFELAPPGTETPLFRGDFDDTDLGTMKGMDVSKLVSLALKEMEKDVFEIRPGLSSPTLWTGCLGRQLHKGGGHSLDNGFRFHDIRHCLDSVTSEGRGGITVTCCELL
jgi:uncharacterized oxidoreductase